MYARRRITRSVDTDITPKGDYDYKRLVSPDERTPFNALWITVNGTHSLRRVIAGIRNYYVIRGTGSFSIDYEVYKVTEGDLITIYPDECYSYEGKMELFEFNIDIGDGIGHEDVT